MKNSTGIRYYEQVYFRTLKCIHVNGPYAVTVSNHNFDFKRLVGLFREFVLCVPYVIFDVLMIKTWHPCGCHLDIYDRLATVQGS